MASPAAVNLSMASQRPTLLQGPGKTADTSGEPEIPKLRFANQDLAEDLGKSEGLAEKPSGGSFLADGELPFGLRPSECLRLQEVTKHYKMGKQIGEGGYGKVFKVQDKKTRKHFALKEVVIPEDKDVTDIETEVANSSEFDHPYILKLHAFFRDGKTYHLVFDLCSGGNLAEHVEEYSQACRQFMPTFRSGLPCKTVMKMVPQMFSGLLYLHHHGFIHRDIKPHNYLRVSAQDDTLKLCDFGMCVHLAPEEQLKKCCGTRGFMAPEVQWGSYDHKADVFSLGITIFAIGTDSVPPEAQDEDGYVRNLQTTLLEARSWQESCPELAALVARLLAVEPRSRPTIKEVMTETAWVMKALEKRRQKSCSAQCSVM